MWTQFMDMHSGGSQKEKWAYIYIEAPEEKAKIIFYNRFGHNPERVTCTCCGKDYSITENKSLEQLTGFERGCATKNDKYSEEPDKKFRFNSFISLEEYMKKKNVLFIFEKDISKDETKGEVPKQGFVWID